MKGGAAKGIFLARQMYLLRVSEVSSWRLIVDFLPAKNIHIYIVAAMCAGNQWVRVCILACMWIIFTYIAYIVVHVCNVC